MKRYNVPRLAFVNKLDRQGSNPQKIVRDLQTKLRLNAALTQLPIGLEDAHRGVVDLVTRKAFTFEGPNGVDVTEAPVRASSAVRAALFPIGPSPPPCRSRQTWSPPWRLPAPSWSTSLSTWTTSSARYSSQMRWVISWPAVPKTRCLVACIQKCVFAAAMLAGADR